MRRKQFFALILAFAMIMSVVPAFAAEGDIAVFVNGDELTGAKGIIIDDLTYLPVRAICEAIELDVDWIDETKSVIVGTKPAETEAHEGVGIYMNGAYLEGSVGKIINDSTYLPVRALCEAIGMDVEWNEENRSVFVTNKGEDVKSALDGGYFRLKHKSTGLYLSVENAATENGAKIVVAEASDNANQEWGFTAVGDGYFKMYNKNSSKSIDMAAQSTEVGHDIEQYTVNGGSNQLVKAVLNDDGSYTFLFRHSSLAVTATERYATQQDPVYDDTQSFEAEYTSVTPLGALRESAGYKALDSVTLERFETYVFSPLKFSVNVLSQVENALLAEDYYSMSSDEQVEFLKKCLKFTAYSGVLTYGEVYPDKEKAAFEIVSKTYVDSFDVWRGSMMPVWIYEIKMDGDVEGQVHEWRMISTVEDSPAVDDAIDAISRMPYAVRKFLKNLIYRVDSANNYNGGGDTIWIRLNFNPGANAYAQSLAHELGHVLDTNLTSDSALWDRAIQADMVPISGYGNNNRAEDLAEFSRLYHMVKHNPADLVTLEKIYPNRFAAYAALLYSADNVYYADYKHYYEKSMAFDDDDEEAKYVSVGINGTNLVLTAENAAEKGSAVTFAENKGSDNQIWRIRTTNGKIALFNKESGLCINVPGNSTDSGKALILWNGGKGDNETMEMTEQNGVYTFKFTHSSLYLGFANETAIQTSSPVQLTVTQAK